MMKISPILLLFFLSTIFISKGQILDITWQSCFGHEGSNYSYALVETVDGYLIGSAALDSVEGVSNFHGASDIWLIHTDSAGTLLWEKCFGGSDHENVRKLIKLTDSTYFIFGRTLSDDGDVQSERRGGYDIWIVKFNLNGTILWEKCYGSTWAEEVIDAIATPDQGLIFMGRIGKADGDVSQHYGSLDVWVVEIDSLGNIIRETSYGNQYLDNAGTIAFTSDTNIIIAGSVTADGGMVDCNANDTYHYDNWILKTDLEGNILWQQCYGGSFHDMAFQIIEEEDGFIISGATSSNDGDVSGYHGSPGMYSPVDIWVYKIDFEGNVLWQRCLGGTDNEFPFSIYSEDNQEYLIIGFTASDDGDISNNHSVYYTEDIWVVNLDFEGDIIWERCYGGLGNDRSSSQQHIRKKHSHYVIAGNTKYVSDDVECELFEQGDKDVWLFEIKDCSLYMPETPLMPAGPDSLCTTTDTISNYQTSSAAGAWYYEWMFSPEDAGTITGDGIEATVNWIKNWEGQAMIAVRSVNDCGYSDWSDTLIVKAYNNLGIDDNLNLSIALSITPNPFTTSTTLSYILERPENVQITFYNLQGRVVDRMEVKQDKGVQRVEWSAEGLPAGLYIMRLQAGNNIAFSKLLLAP